LPGLARVLGGGEGIFFFAPTSPFRRAGYLLLGQGGQIWLLPVGGDAPE
jgi:hypothetical protein